MKLKKRPTDLPISKLYEGMLKRNSDVWSGFQQVGQAENFPAHPRKSGYSTK